MQCLETKPIKTLFNLLRYVFHPDKPHTYGHGS